MRQSIRKKTKKSLFRENRKYADGTKFWILVQHSFTGEELEAGEYLYKGTAYGIKDKNGEFTFGKDNEGKPQNYQQKWEFERNLPLLKKLHKPTIKKMLMS